MRAGSSRALARDQLTADDVRAGLDYDPETGIFIHKKLIKLVPDRADEIAELLDLQQVREAAQ